MKYIFLCFAMIGILSYSCQKDMQLDLKTNDKRLLVDGEFTNDMAFHHIKLYRSGSLTTGRPQETVSGAAIYLTDRVDTIHYAETNTSGLYQTAGKCCGKGGVTYYLSIAGIDIDEDGKEDSYTAAGTMPTPVEFDSLTTKRSLNGDNELGVGYWGYYKIIPNSPAYIFPYVLINNQQTKWGTIGENLGTGLLHFNTFFKQPKADNPDSKIPYRVGYYNTATITQGDSMSFVGLNFTRQQFDFFKAFDNNTSGDSFTDTAFDQLRIPSNLPTNIEPSDKAAGYFFIYSVSRISKVFEE